MEKLSGILLGPQEKWQKNALILKSHASVNRGSIYSLKNITFGALPPPNPFKSLSRVREGSKLKHTNERSCKKQEKTSKYKQNKPNEETLRNLYWKDKLSLPELGRYFNVHRTTVSRWMKSYGIERRNSKLWTMEEILVLKKFYPKLRKIKMILPLLPNRTLGSIHKKAQDLGIKWTPRKKPNQKMLESLYKILGTKGAAKHLGISPTHFRRWAKSLNIKLKSPIKRPNLVPSADLMYVLGVLKGDGCVYKRGRAYLIELSTKSKEFAKSFASALKKLNLTPSLRTRLIKKYENYRVYTVTAISKIFVEWYKGLSLTQIREMIGENRGLAVAFVRGFYEAEGSYIIDPRDGSHSISICNMDLSLLLFVKEMVSSLGYDLNINNAPPTCTGKPFYRLRKCGKTIPKLISAIEPHIKARPSNIKPELYKEEEKCQ